MKHYYILISILIGQFIYCQTSFANRPNILIAISDDQSFPHMSASGCKFVNTPAFDRIADNGVIFSNAFVTSPGCAPSRASLVMGRYPWQNEHAGNHSAIWPKKLIPFPDLLEDKGYFIGFTGKGVEPFEHGLGGRDINPAGYEFNEFKNNPPARPGIDRVDYAENFKAFLNEKDDDSPFCFMYLSKEPHRGFELGSGVKSGKSTKDVTVPPFLPDTEEIRSDLLDYALEIEWFDLHLARILKLLEERGELDNTIIIVTSDNGMAFPSSKALCYEYGIHVPLAISWGDKIKGGRTVDDLVGLIDIYPTLFEILDLPLPVNNPVEGKSMANILFSDKEGEIDNTRKAMYAGTRNFPEPDWVKSTDPKKIDHLLKTLEEDNEPIVFPEEIGDWGLKMGRWELVKAGENKWKLYNIEKDPEKTKDLSTQKYRVVDNLIKLYDYSMVPKSK